MNRGTRRKKSALESSRVPAATCAALAVASILVGPSVWADTAANHVKDVKVAVDGSETNVTVVGTMPCDYNIVVDGRRLPRPVNYLLVEIIPPEGVMVSPWRGSFGRSNAPARMKAPSRSPSLAVICRPSLTGISCSAMAEWMTLAAAAFAAGVPDFSASR